MTSLLVMIRAMIEMPVSQCSLSKSPSRMSCESNRVAISFRPSSLSGILLESEAL